MTFLEDMAMTPDKLPRVGCKWFGSAPYQPQHRVLACLLLAVTLIVGGCGRAQRSASSTTVVPASQTTSPHAAATSGVLERRDAPPAGVAAQVAFYAGAGGSTECTEEDFRASAGPSLTAEPHTVTTNHTVRVFEDIMVCPAGFAEGRSVIVEVLSPDRHTDRKTVPPGDGYYFSKHPSDPLGEYQFTAT